MVGANPGVGTAVLYVTGQQEESAVHFLQKKRKARRDWGEGVKLCVGGGGRALHSQALLSPSRWGRLGGGAPHCRAPCGHTERPVYVLGNAKESNLHSFIHPFSNEMRKQIHSFSQLQVSNIWPVRPDPTL